MIKVQFSALLDGISARKDHTLAIRLGSQELTPEESSYLFSLMGSQLWVGIAETEIKELEVPEILPEMVGEKSPSLRLKAVLYKLWELKTDQKEPFPRFYENTMFRIIENYKNKLD
jgi:hypothetical protein